MTTSEEIEHLVRRVNEMVESHPGHRPGCRAVAAPLDRPGAVIWEHIAYLDGNGAPAPDQTPLVWALLKLSTPQGSGQGVLGG